MKYRTRLDAEKPIFDESGHLNILGEAQAHLATVLSDYPLIGRWIASLGVPDAEAHRAQESTLEILKDPDALVELLHLLSGPIPSLDDDLLLCAISTTFLAGITGPLITASGTLRQWLAYGPGRSLVLQGLGLDTSASVEDVENYWRTGLEVSDLIDIGNRIGPADFPAPTAEISIALENVSLEGSPDEAEERVQQLFTEAKEARQWSIPWGARVQVRFGPFVAMRIFEHEQEFSCHFLDNKARYVHVAIGLQGSRPRINSPRFARKRHDDGVIIFNLYAQISLELIAAAIVRDFLIVEERDGVFGSRPMRRRIAGRDVRTIIYLPRVRYSAPHPERLATDSVSSRVRHTV